MGIKSDQAGTWYVIGLHWADRRVNESITVECGQKKQVQRREQEALGAESCSSVGVSQGDGKGDGGQRACQSFRQDLVPKYYVNGNTSRNFTKWYKDNKKKNT